MATERETWREQSLALQDELAAQVTATAHGLDDSAWAAPTNCPPWTVRDILKHLTRSAGTFRSVVDRGLKGDQSLAVDQVERDRVERELNAMSAQQLIDQFGVSQQSFQDRLASLAGDELEVLCPHSRG